MSYDDYDDEERRFPHVCPQCGDRFRGGGRWREDRAWEGAPLYCDLTCAQRAYMADQ